MQGKSGRGKEKLERKVNKMKKGKEATTDTTEV